jgi:brother of ihog
VSKPNITRLDDESVMVKWSVVPSSTDGSLPIQFFKVQYMQTQSNDHSYGHKGQRQKEDWMTLNEDIPPHLRSYEIHNLKLGHHYKFRISAVYSNNDNKQSPSRRFIMKRVNQNTKLALPVPTDVHVSPVSETEVAVRWSIPEYYRNIS